MKGLISSPEVQKLRGNICSVATEVLNQVNKVVPLITANNNDSGRALGSCMADPLEP